MSSEKLVLRTLGAFALAGVCVALGCGSATPSGAVVGVLDTRGKLHVIDLERGKLSRSVNLRSIAYDIAADLDTKCFVTAQSGGLAEQTDNRLGIIADRGQARPVYVELPRDNPTGVEVVRPGVALVDHGILTERGAFVSLVDTLKRSVIKTGAIPDNNGPLAVAAGSVWSSGIDGQTYRRSLRRVDERTLESTEVLAPGEFPMIEASEGGSLYGWLSPEYGRGSVARFDADTAAVEASRALALQGGCGDIAVAGGRLVVADWAAQDLSDTGDTVHVLDPTTLEELARIEVPGGACDVQAWGDRVIVASYADSKLLVVDPVSARIEKRIALPRIGLPFRIAVMDSR